MKLIEPGVVVRVTKSKAVGMVVSVDPKHDDITLVFYNRDRKKYTVVEGFTIGQAYANNLLTGLTQNRMNTLSHQAVDGGIGHQDDAGRIRRDGLR